MSGLSDSSIEDHQAYGDAVIQRLASAPARLKPFVKAFGAQHKAYVAANARVKSAKEKRDAALRAVSDADDAQDGSVDELASALVGANLGTRIKPLAAFTKKTVSELKVLALKTEANEIAALVKTVLAKKPPAAVKSACVNALKHAGGALAAIAHATKPEADYHQACIDRDAHLPAWTLAMSRLKKESAAAWVETPAKYKAAFAPADKIASPKKKRAKSTTPTNAKPPPPATAPS